MKNWKKVVIIIAAVALAVFVIWKIATYKQPVFTPEPFEIHNAVYNRTTKTYLDTVVQLSLNTLDIKGINIIVTPLTDVMKSTFSDQFDLKASIVKKDSVLYYLFVDDISQSESIGIISHEMIHLQQYYTKQLVVNHDTIIWEGIPLLLNSEQYLSRPWEVQAFEQGKNLEWILTHKLYNLYAK